MIYCVGVYAPNTVLVIGPERDELLDIPSGIEIEIIG